MPLARDDKSSVWAMLPHRWVHTDLPGYREAEGIHTYCGFAISELPPVNLDLDDGCEWLLKFGIPQLNGLNQYEPHCLKPAMVRELARQAGINLPKSFEQFMTAPELQERVRSCTDCYLDPVSALLKRLA
jgi:hypothetical protein